jgi:hypothetical protein
MRISSGPRAPSAYRHNAREEREVRGREWWSMACGHVIVTLSTAVRPCSYEHFTLSGKINHTALGHCDMGRVCRDHGALRGTGVLTCARQTLGHQAAERVGVPRAILPRHDFGGETTPLVTKSL